MTYGGAYEVKGYEKSKRWSPPTESKPFLIALAILLVMGWFAFAPVEAEKGPQRTFQSREPVSPKVGNRYQEQRPLDRITSEVKPIHPYKPIELTPPPKFERIEVPPIELPEIDPPDPVEYAGYPRPENGADVAERRTNDIWRPILTIKNGSNRDALVRIESRGKRVAAIYIHQRSNYDIKGLEPGDYVIKFRQGVNWDPDTLKFKFGNNRSRFRDVLTLEEFTEQDGTVRFSHDTLTLNTVWNGNAKTDEISEAEFNRIGS
ncbi:MAG: hypothetical protein ACAH95_17050 [Fimbriimonas sp.]